MSDRPSKLWRLVLHRTPPPKKKIVSFAATEIAVLLQVIVTAMSVASVAVIPIFHRDKVGHRLVCSTFILQGFLLYRPCYLPY